MHSGPSLPDDTVTVSTVPPAAGGAAPPNRIDQDTILYVFVEGAPLSRRGRGQSAPEGTAASPETKKLPPETKLPRFYLGEFTAAAVTDNSVTLKPTMPLGTKKSKSCAALHVDSP